METIFDTANPETALYAIHLIAKLQVENCAQILDINRDEGTLDGPIAMAGNRNLISSEPDITNVALCMDSFNLAVIEVGLKTPQGECVINLTPLKPGETDCFHKAKNMSCQAADRDTKMETCETSYSILVDKTKFSPNDTILDPII